MLFKFCEFHPVLHGLTPMESFSLSQVYLCLFSHSPSTLTTNESLHRYQGRPSGSGAWVLSDFGGATADERMGGAMTPGIITSLFAPSKALNI
ncbi:hypothetical protein QQF64_008419 [Cirrhinus molitorella]|uniref:Uncharacterized protein n=1 Tax=Cirrhinus molitorella TaxID=172907 RepID=A0ABR3M9J9_9TELE